MRVRNKKTHLLVLLLALCTFLFSGCTIGDRMVFFSAGPGFHNLFRIGNMKCPEQEWKVYLTNTKNLYRQVGDKDLWADGFDTEELEESLEQGVLAHLTRVYSLNIYAEEQEIALTEKEEEGVKKAAKEYFESLDKKEIEVLGVGASDIEDMYERYALASKVFSLLMEQVDEEVSEDEARIMDAYVLKVSDAETAKKISEVLEQGGNFQSLLVTYGEGEKSILSFGRNTYPEEMEDVIFRLDNDEISDCIETNDGYYFVYCVNKYNPELSEENKESVINKRKEQLIDDIVSQQNEIYYSEINTELLEKMKEEDFSDVGTNSFFSVLESHVTF